MSRSKKDGRRGGGHASGRRYEVWSGRFKKVNYWTQSGPLHKHLTVRFERRQAKAEIASEVNQRPA